MNDLKFKAEKSQKDKLELALRLQKIKKEFCATSRGESFQLLEPLLASATLASTLVTLPKGASSILLGAVIATIGIKISESPGGVLGPHLEKIIETLVNGLQSSELWQQKIDLAGLLMLEKLVLITVLGALLLGRWIGTNKGNALVEAEAEITRITCDLLILMLASTPYVKIALLEMLRAVGTNEKAQDITGEILTFVFVCFSALAVTKTIKQKPEDFFENLHAFFKRSLTKIETALFEKKWEISYLPVVLQQAKLAAENENFMALSDVSKNLFEELGVSKEGFDKDCECIFSLADMLINACTKGTDVMASPGTTLSVLA